MDLDKLQYMEIGNSFFLSYKSFPKINMSLCTRYFYLSAEDGQSENRICFFFDHGNYVDWTFDSYVELSSVGKELGLEE